ncbi:MAG TPA: CDP-glucose 4,6-dehydratase [Chitinophagales bacterium]|nr:CDP-glucose 4,6-dehydratase [Chitinophagales bacterium]
MLKQHLTHTFKNKKILVTGNTGFKGSWLSLALLHMGAKVYGLSRDEGQPGTMYHRCGLGNNVELLKGDIRSFDFVMKSLQQVKPDFIFHLAAQPLTLHAVDSPLETIDINVMGTTNILEALRKLNRKVVCILVTSDKCYDNKEWLWGYRETDPLGGKDPYSASKAACEIIANAYHHTFATTAGFKIATVRAGNIIGGGDLSANRIIPDCVKNWQQNKPVVLRSPKATRPWQHVLDPITGYLTVAAMLSSGKMEGGNAFNFGPEVESVVPVENLVDRFYAQWDSAKPKKYKKITADKNSIESGLLKLNCDKAKEILGWKPKLDLDNALRYCANWYIAAAKPRTDMMGFSVQQIESYFE